MLYGYILSGRLQECTGKILGTIAASYKVLVVVNTTLLYGRFLYDTDDRRELMSDRFDNL